MENFKDIDFSDVLTHEPELERHLDAACKDQVVFEANSEDKDKPKLDIDYERFIVANNLPKVEEAKFDKLVGVIKKVFTELIAAPLSVEMPYGKDKKTQGFAFLEFRSPDEAKIAASAGHGAKIGGVLTCVSFADHDRILQISDKYNEPELYPKTALKEWLMDGRSRDQFLCRFEDGIRTYWHDSIEKQPPAANDGSQMLAETPDLARCPAIWSTQGTYLMVLHKLGVNVFGGNELKKVTSFDHAGVTFASMDPTETYIVTLNEAPEAVEGEGEQKRQQSRIVVWDLTTGEILRKFEAEEGENSYSCKWSPDGKYLARQRKDLVSVFELPSMDMLTDPQTKEKSSIKMKGIDSMEWSPVENVLAIVSNNENALKSSTVAASRLTLLALPTRKTLSTKNLFSSGNQIYWQMNGDYIYVGGDILTKGGKRSEKVLNILKFREKGYPLILFDSRKKPIVDFCWEARGNRFVILEDAGGIARTVGIYAFVERTSDCIPLGSVAVPNFASHVAWAPQGNHIAVATIGSPVSTANGVMDFLLLDEHNEVFSFTKQREAEIRHPQMTDFSWDDTGRFMITYQRQSSDGDGVSVEACIWNCQGTLHYQSAKRAFSQIEWRPRPQALLALEKQKEILSNLKEYSKRYIQEDKRIKEANKAAIREHRKNLRDEMCNYLTAKADKWASERAQREKILGYEEERSGDWIEKEIVIEE
eukprot:CAMPEP_0115022694 /NCGR_PEP_ID=MMETSP0216-20121206/31746_1 /TAXON_ID=223996 /ORGANISM="Protocruzia adherens, Strain Boccale" /LENGTH=704 /DNA_ID=CAMNT_0002395513 /DNA_START=22 /DNA_END=2136 /DNA_ORIENTATION=-